jgi:DNA-binding Lrp family transcriptional regulator
MLTTDYMAGYILIDVGHGDVQRVVDRLLQHPNVHRAHALLGPTDIIAFVEADGWESFIAILDRHVRGLIDDRLIRQTETRLVVQSTGVGLKRSTGPAPSGSAWVFIDVGVGDPEPVIRKLEAIGGVVRAHGVIGPCDIIAYLECQGWEDLMQVVDEQIGALPEITRTDTRLVLMGNARRA